MLLAIDAAFLDRLDRQAGMSMLRLSTLIKGGTTI